ncbi:MAG: hypothetical protein NT087_01520, partial [Deltaproteobacteria bacterium]|nr:hypothetical protein [Deltaproteobacteria bacterium]
AKPFPPVVIITLHPDHPAHRKPSGASAVKRLRQAGQMRLQPRPAKILTKFSPYGTLAHLHTTAAMLIYIPLWLFAGAFRTKPFSETPSAFFQDYKADLGAVTE